jgi:two-component system, LuxR family, sensor kinase FixL
MNSDLVEPIEVAEQSSAQTSILGRDAGRRFVEAYEQTQASGLDAMGAALAHELNQPLAALTIYLQSLQRYCLKADDTVPIVQEMVDKSLREALRAGEIVRRMRRFSARSEPDRHPFDINTFAEESIDLAMVGAARTIALSRDFATDLPLLSGDSGQIRQIMVNMLRNAIEATSGKSLSRITVTTALSQGFCHFRVADNGPGISASMVGRLFKAFETSKPQGMGLGLAISRMIAQNHNGDLALEPGGIGSGACFGLKLPAR